MMVTMDGFTETLQDNKHDQVATNNNLDNLESTNFGEATLDAFDLVLENRKKLKPKT